MVENPKDSTQAMRDALNNTSSQLPSQREETHTPYTVKGAEYDMRGLRRLAQALFNINKSPLQVPSNLDSNLESKKPTVSRNKP